MNIAVKTVIASAALAVTAALGAPLAHADTNDATDTVAATHTGTHTTNSAMRQTPKFEPGTKTSRSWGPSQFG